MCVSVCRSNFIMADSISVNLNSTNYLLKRFEEIKSEQGFIGKFFNGIKETLNLGRAESDCESKLQEYKNGKISFEQALQYIEEFERKQENFSELATNIATGVGAIATTALALGTGGSIGVPLAITKGAPVGALIKTGLKTLDRATNNIQDDALDAKAMAKDAITGAAVGATSAVSSNMALGVKQGKFGLSVLNSAKCGIACGAASGAINYTADVAFDNERKFNFGELSKNVATSALVSGTVGAAVGGGYYGVESLVGNTCKEVTRSTAETIVSDSTTSTARKLLANAERHAFAA